MRDLDFFRSFCSGCGLCHSVCKTELRINKRGFLEPETIDIEFANKYCPIADANCESLCNSNSIWGDYYKVRRGYSSDATLRKKASSGGVISEIASYLLENEYVDEVIHIGACGPFSSKVYYSKTREEVLSHTGSRYIQTSVLYDLFQKFDIKKKYAFVGKPCDVMILRKYARENNMNNIIYYFSFFCAGMPSLNIHQSLVKAMGCNEEVDSLTYRGDGWPGLCKVISKNGTEYTMPYESAWGQILGRDKHKLCRLCMDGIGLFADVVCADAWYIKNNKPDFSEHNGRSIIITRTKLGEELIERMMKSEAILTEEYKAFDEEMPIVQKYQRDRRATMKYQLLALKLLGKRTPNYPLAKLKKYSDISDMKSNYEIFWGTLKRIYRGRYN